MYHILLSRQIIDCNAAFAIRVALVNDLSSVPVFLALGNTTTASTQYCIDRPSEKVMWHAKTVISGSVVLWRRADGEVEGIFIAVWVMPPGCLQNALH